MIELPEALTVAAQMTHTVTGKRVREALANASPHKFAFYTGDPAAYASLLVGQKLGPARAGGKMIYLPVGSELTLVLGEGGERILHHAAGARLPDKHQLWLAFEDDTHLTVSIQGWGFVGLMDPETLTAHVYAGRTGPSPLDDGFTLDAFTALFDALPAGDSRSIKAFVVSDPGMRGIGNGCLQDVLFHAGLHPRRRAVELARPQQKELYRALRSTLRQMVEQGGRDSELDLYGHPGRYERLFHSGTVGQPCPVCGTPIEKQSFLGGSVYFCPACQPEPALKAR